MDIAQNGVEREEQEGALQVTVRHLAHLRLHVC